MAEMPGIEKMAKQLADKALDGVLYKGRSIRAWIEAILKFDWTPASEPPKEDGEYFVTMKCGFEETEWTHTKVDSYRFSRGGWASDDVDGKVIAWMMLPEEYKDGSDIKSHKECPHKPCINYEDGCEEWAGCPCVYYKAESEE